MISIPLQQTGTAVIAVDVATLHGKEISSDGTSMVKIKFIWDTGATQTSIPKSTLIDELGYTDDYIRDNKILIPEKEKPLMADWNRADVYKVPGTRMNIGGYELQPDAILTSDSIKNLGFLLGFNILRKFIFTFNPDIIDDDAPYGRMFFELSKTNAKPFSKLGDEFAYQMDTP